MQILRNLQGATLLLLALSLVAVASTEATAAATPSLRRAVQEDEAATTTTTTTTTEEEVVVVEEDAKVHGGVDAADGEFPYFIQFDDASCGGTLISRNRVLTAARCIDANGPPATVIISGNKDVGVGASYSVVASTIHPNYNSTAFGLKNDIAVLLLARDVNQPFVTLNRFTNEPPVGSAVVVIGFGEDETNQPTKVLQKLTGTDYKTVSNSDCKAVYGDEINEGGVICVQNTNTVGSCRGDFGGPLLSSTNNTLQYGIVSGGDASCATNSALPDVYTDVAVFQFWIDNQFQNDGRGYYWWCLRARKRASENVAAMLQPLQGWLANEANNTQSLKIYQF